MERRAGLFARSAARRSSDRGAGAVRWIRSPRASRVAPRADTWASKAAAFISKILLYHMLTNRDNRDDRDTTIESIRLFGFGVSRFFWATA
jgi:hypothetical protein